MASWKQLSTPKKAAIGLLALGIAAAALWQYQSSTKVSYYEVDTQTVEQLINVSAQTYPKVSHWVTVEEAGIVTLMPYDKEDAVVKDEVLMQLQPFDFTKKQEEIRGYEDTLNTLVEVALSPKDQVVFKEKLKSCQDQDQALTQAWLAHDSVLKLFQTQMISSDAYKESLIQINDQMKLYISKTTEFEQYLDTLDVKDQQFAALTKTLKSSWEPVKALSLLMAPSPGDGKTAAPAAASEKLLEFKALESGIVSRRTADQGMYVPKGAPVVEVADPSMINLQLEVAVDQLPDLEAGSEVRVKDSSNQVVKGKLTEIDKVITDQMQSDGSIIKLVKVTAELEKDSKVGLYKAISASVVANYAENAVVVPKELVYVNKGKYSVWTNQNGVLSEKVVEVSFETEDLCVIKAGLVKGDKLVMDTKLRLGQKIKF